MASHEQETLNIVTVDEDTSHFLPSNRCCFNLPCFGSSSSSSHHRLSSSSSSPSIWDKIRVAEAERKWWATPIIAIKKIREWSEIIAGPKWKTFIRRFNRNRTGANKHSGGGATAAGKFGYDPLSYALNFDEGPMVMMMRNRGGGDDGDCDPDEEYGYYPDFMSRYGSVSLASKMSTTAVG